MFRDYTKYEVFEDGRIWSYVSNKWLKPYKMPNGYMTVRLSDNDNKIHTEMVHKITFFAVNGLAEYPSGMQINHIDENKENNHISNLELVTSKENNNHGTHNERIAKAKSKKVAAYNAEGELVMVFDSTQEAQRNGYYSSAVSQCCNGKRKTHKGYTWKYLEDDE